MAENNESELSILRTEITREVAKQTAKWLVFLIGAAALVAVTGWWLYLKPKLVEITGGVPSGVVVAVDGPDMCPPGWIEFNEAAGRTIIGAGEGQGLSERVYREQGGAESHVLTVPELPSHTHEVIRMVPDNNIDGVDSTTTRSGDHHNQALMSAAAGGGGAHNNMPPFITLKYCKKR